MCVCVSCGCRCPQPGSRSLSLVGQNAQWGQTLTFIQPTTTCYMDLFIRYLPWMPHREGAAHVPLLPEMPLRGGGGLPTCPCAFTLLYSYSDPMVQLIPSIVPQQTGTNQVCASYLFFHVPLWGRGVWGLDLPTLFHIWIPWSLGYFFAPGLGVCASAWWVCLCGPLMGCPTKPTVRVDSKQLGGRFKCLFSPTFTNLLSQRCILGLCSPISWNGLFHCLPFSFVLFSE
jgi:hypothetical protein